MAYDIDDAVLKKAHKCTKSHGCLNSENDCLSPVEQLFAGKNSRFAYVRCDQRIVCSYKTAFGTDTNPVCSCPVRIEIYKRYGE
jgi:hypothetical protein